MPSAHVVALAARTPVGLTAASSTAAIAAGISRLQEHPFYVDAWGNPVRCGYDGRLDPRLGLTERLLELLRSTLDEVAQQIAVRSPYEAALPILVALPQPRPGCSAALLDVVAKRTAGLRPRGISKPSIRAVGRGHAGAVVGFQQAVQLITNGMTELCIVAGVDSYLDGATLDWLEGERMLACVPARGGFPPGEGAAAVALASSGIVRGMGLRTLAIVRGLGTAADPNPQGPDVEPLGVGLTAVVRDLASGLRPNERFDQHYTDINGERSRTTDLTFALLRAAKFFTDSNSYKTAVDCVGDLGAATLPLGCVVAIGDWIDGRAAGKTALISASSWGPDRAAVFLERGV